MIKRRSLKKSPEKHEQFHIDFDEDKDIPKILAYVKQNNIKARFVFAEINYEKYFDMLYNFVKNYKNVDEVEFQCRLDDEKLMSYTNLEKFAKLFPYVNITSMELFNHDDSETFDEVVEDANKYMQQSTKLDLIKISMKMHMGFSVKFSKSSSSSSSSSSSKSSSYPTSSSSSRSSGYPTSSSSSRSSRSSRSSYSYKRLKSIPSLKSTPSSKYSSYKTAKNSISSSPEVIVVKLKKKNFINLNELNKIMNLEEPD